jgi:hypothetical protein
MGSRLWHIGSYRYLVLTYVAIPGPYDGQTPEIDHYFGPKRSSIQYEVYKMTVTESSRWSVTKRDVEVVAFKTIIEKQVQKYSVVNKQGMNCKAIVAAVFVFESWSYW